MNKQIQLNISEDEALALFSVFTLGSAFLLDVIKETGDEEKIKQSATLCYNLMLQDKNFSLTMHNLHEKLKNISEAMVEK